MPAWASKQPVLVYVTERNGPAEIWAKAEGSDRPLVTARDFPPGTTKFFMGPVPSPQGDRVAYTRIDGADRIRLWLSAASGGSPAPMTNDESSEYPGSWSPDGNWFVYTRRKEGRRELAKVKTTGQAAPVLLKTDVPPARIPSWSPTGGWIAIGDDLFSPDGKRTRSLGQRGSPYYMFSADGKRVYGIRSEGQRNLLFSVDIDSGVETVIGDLGKDSRPASHTMPGIRFSLAPDGKSFVFGVGKTESNIWLLEGFAGRPGLFARFGL
jgi:hypothetical protein